MTLSRSLIVLLCISIFARLVAFGIATQVVGVQSFVSGDAVGYVQLATSLIEGSGFVQPDGTPEVFRTPGFPLILAPFITLPNGLAIYGFVMAIVAGALLPLLLYKVGKRFVGVRAALLSAALIAIEPHAVFYSFLPQTEVPFMLFALGGFLAALLAYERFSSLFAVFSGALFGYAAFIRPGWLDILIALLAGVAVVLYFSRDRRYRFMLVSLLMLGAVLAPWYMRMHAVTGVYAISGAGWRNVYTDYVSSVRSIDKGTNYSDEKNNLKEEALPRFGITRDGVDDPANATVLRDASFAELSQHKATVIKLETSLLISFFINDGYYYEFRNLGFVSDAPGGHISPTAEFLTHGLSAIPAIVGELWKQRFIPLVGRLFTVAIVGLALAGFFLMKNRMRYLFAAAICMSAVFATAIGLGLDARMRVPVEPLLFMLASVAIIRLFDMLPKRYALRSLRSRAE